MVIYRFMHIIETQWKETSLHIAVHQGNVDCIRCLINEGRADLADEDEVSKA